MCQTLCIEMKRSKIRGIRSGLAVGCDLQPRGQDGPQRRETFEHGCEGGELCQNLDNRNNHKGKHLPRTDSIWRGAIALTLELEQQSQICQPKLLMTQNNKELSHFPRSTPCFFSLPKNFF